MAHEVEFTVVGADGTRAACRGSRGESLLDALRHSGFELPSLCHLSPLEPYGACRLCLVEVEKGGRRRLTTSCDYPLEAGISVHLDTERVLRHRRIVLELLLASAPDAPELRALASRYGVERSRFEPSPEGGRCILCGLCVRVCRQGARAEAISLAGRGRDKRLADRPFDEFPSSCIGCGACAQVCPTGAISMEEIAVAGLRQRWGEPRPCRFALMGLTPGAVCEHDYACASCEVDQRMRARAGDRHPIFLMLAAREEGSP